MSNTMIAWCVFAGLLVGLGCFLAVWLRQKSETAQPEPPLARATRDLPALHLLTKADVDWAAKTEKEKQDAVNAEQDADFKKCLQGGFVNCILLNETKEGEELKSSFVRSSESGAAKLLLEKSVEAAIPANTSTTLGGRLRVGDVVEIIWFQAADSALNNPQYIDRLVVASVPTGKVPDAPAPTPAAAPTSAQNPAGASSAADGRPPAPADTRPAAPPAAVIGLKLCAEQVKDLFTATTGGSKWMLMRKTHLSNYIAQNDVPICAKSQPTKQPTQQSTPQSTQQSTPQPTSTP